MTIGSILKFLNINCIYFSRSADCAMFQCYLKHLVLLFEAPKTTHFLQNSNIFEHICLIFHWNLDIISWKIKDFSKILPIWGGSISTTIWSISKKLGIKSIYSPRYVDCAMSWTIFEKFRVPPKLTKWPTKSVFWLWHPYTYAHKLFIKCSK